MSNIALDAHPICARLKHTGPTTRKYDWQVKTSHWFFRTGYTRQRKIGHWFTTRGLTFYTCCARRWVSVSSGMGCGFLHAGILGSRWSRVISWLRWKKQTERAWKTSSRVGFSEDIATKRHTTHKELGIYKEY